MNFGKIAIVQRVLIVPPYLLNISYLLVIGKKSKNHNKETTGKLLIT